MKLHTTISNCAIAALLLIYLCGIFSGDPLSVPCALAASVIFLSNILFMGKTFRIPAWIFSIIGILVLLLTKAPFSQWVYGFNSMLKSVIILIAIQPLSIAIEAGHY